MCQWIKLTAVVVELLSGVNERYDHRSYEAIKERKNVSFGNACLTVRVLSLKFSVFK